MKFYSVKNILEKKAQYNIVFGERSNGKTYAALKYGIEQYVKNGSQIALIRRWKDDLIGKRGATMFDNLVNNEEISTITKGEWTDIYYYSGRWWFCRRDKDDENKIVKADEPFAFGFSISTMEHDKSSSFPKIKTVIFDEFLTRSAYLPNEFVLFMNVLSTIIRYKDDVKIFMLGNTVNQYCPYFSEMGLNHIKQMKQGDIDVYDYGDTGLRVAVEYSDSPNKGKPSDKYFAFNNPHLHMITSGTWEIDIYPHCPYKIFPKDILLTYFIKFDNEILQCEIVLHERALFTYIHRKTGDIKNEDEDIIYSPVYDARPNWKRKINQPTNTLEKQIASFFIKDKVFYQDNEIGEIVRNYLLWCTSTKI